MVTTRKLITIIKTAIDKVTEAHKKESGHGEMNTHSAFWKEVDKEESVDNEFEWMAKIGRKTKVESKYLEQQKNGCCCWYDI